MKKINLLCVLSFVFLLLACSSVGNQVDNKNNENPQKTVSDNKDYYTSLADFLRRIPGVSVTGSGENVHVRMRGINSFNTGVTPLCVIDGQAVGSSYPQANSMVDPRDIGYVKVLKGPEASTYGM